MEYGSGGLALTKEFEGCELKAYLDTGGVPTLGRGHTKGVKMGMTCTQKQADQWLLEDIQDAVKAANKLIRVPVTQNQFDACVDMIFNVGDYAFGNSTLCRMLNEKNYAGAAEQFLRWEYDNGKKVAGLTRRCEARKKLFNTP
jgi:lysozyme